jgi:hypothetical protein
VEMFLGGAWVDISTDVRMDAGVNITFGVQSESATADPATCNLTVNNRDGKYSPRNAAGPYYGQLTRNTPLRVKVGAQPRFAGEVSEFPARWNIPGSDVWTPLVASGVLRRLVRSNALESPLRSGIVKIAANNHVTGYWPMEDLPGSTSFVSEIAGAGPGFVNLYQVVYANVDPGPSSLPIPTWQWAMGVFYARGGAASTSFTAAFMLAMPEAGTTNGAELVRIYVDGTARTWVFTYDTGSAGQLRLTVYNSAGASIFTSLYPGTAGLNGRTTFIKLEANNNGANVDFYVQPYPGSGTPGNIAAQSVGAAQYAYVGTGQLITGDVGIGHLILGDTNTALFTAGLDQALAAYSGETVGARMLRVAALAGVSMTVTAGPSENAWMGTQPDGSALDVMRAAEAADVGGILRDAIDTVGLVYITRAARYNNAQAGAVLDYDLNRFSPPLEPVDDDANTRNDVTVTRNGGSSARAVKLAGALNAQPYPLGIGAYPYAVTLDLSSDTILPDVANWLLTLGTIDETRWPRITVDLLQHADIANALELLRPGWRLDLINLPAWVGAETAALHVIGWTETITASTRHITFNCQPAGPFHVFELDTEAFGRLAPTTAVTNEALDATETGVDFTGEALVTTAANPTAFPFDILIGGERMTVTSATAGTLTVVRSVNGVVKTHLTAAAITLAEPVVLAL